MDDGILEGRARTRGADRRAGARRALVVAAGMAGLLSVLTSLASEVRSPDGTASMIPASMIPADGEPEPARTA